MNKPKHLQTNKHNNNQPVAFQMQQVQQHKTVFDPDVVEHYARLVPDAPERILQILEQNNKAERTAREAPYKENARRDWMAFAIVIFGISAALVLAYLDKPYLSAGTIGTMVIYAVIAYAASRKAPSSQ